MNFERQEQADYTINPSACGPTNGVQFRLRRKHADTYLNEFVFRYNRRFYRRVSFETLLGLAANKEPTSYWDLIKRENPRKNPDRSGLTPIPYIDEPESTG